MKDIKEKPTKSVPRSNAAGKIPKAALKKAWTEAKEKNCDRIVAAAAPPVPSLRMPIKRKSRAMFVVMAAARKDRATLVLPIDRRIPDKRL